MKPSRLTNPKPRGTLAGDNPWNLHDDSSWGNKKQAEEKGKTHIQSPEPRRDVDPPYGIHRSPQAQHYESHVQSPGSRRDVDPPYGIHRSPQAQHYESPGSRRDVDPAHGSHRYPQAQYYESHVQSPGSRRDVDPPYGIHRSPQAQHYESPGSRRDVDPPYGIHRSPQAQHYESEIPNQTPNLDFYQNKKRFEPNGVLIDELLTKWKYDYNRLEMNHSYIQWLFPLCKPGINPKAKPLTQYEIERMKTDKEVIGRFLNAYELMLGFFGIKLKDKRTGSVERDRNYRERFENLNNYTHNNLRITRILKCLALLGYEHFQTPLVMFFLEETLRNNNLQNVKSSVSNHFLLTVKDDIKYKKLREFESQLTRESSLRTSGKKR
ncbi:uncharacterized protein ACMZJ9_012839 [Mantella aurantiaca]